jgi:hypothetical protein
MEIKESLRFVLNVWQFNNPTLFFNYSDIAINLCTHVYVHLVDKNHLIDSRISRDKQREEKIIVKPSYRVIME